MHSLPQGHKPETFKAGVKFSGKGSGSIKSRLARGKALQCRSSASVSLEGRLESVRSEIARLAGPKYGTDKAAEEKEAIANVALSLTELDRKDITDMTGSKWKLVFTESVSTSAGKLGPFVGKVIQDFPADKPGQYINWLYLGPVKIHLLADYKQPDKDRIDVSFQYLQVELGIWKWKKELKAQGTWDSIYIDDNYRVFRANKKNIFVLEKLPQ